MENSTKIKIPYHFASANAVLSWSDIKFGIQYNFLDRNDAIAHAVDELGKIESPSSNLEKLAFLFKGEEIEPFLSNLLKLSCDSENEIKEKWIYLVLKWVFEHKDSIYKNPLDLIELIYSDFDYPDSIVDLVKYMPNENFGKYDVTGKNALFQAWEDYLVKQGFLYNVS